MKKMIYIIIALLASSSAHAVQHSATCQMNGQNGIEVLQILSESSIDNADNGRVILHYTDGSKEALLPTQKNSGVFGGPSFDSYIKKFSPTKKTFALVKNKAGDEIMMAVNCNNPHSDIYCISRGGSANTATVYTDVNGHNSQFTCDFEVLTQ